MLQKMKNFMSKGNEWIFGASMIDAVFSKIEDDCIIEDRNDHLFDTSMAEAFMIL